jgi:hypothetical protein
MTNDLQHQVIAGLAQRKGEWKKIANDLRGVVSYSLISQLGRGKYTSETSYKKLKAINEYLTA